MSNDDDSDLGLVWKALADPTRRAILDQLAERPRTTGELAAHFTTSRSLSRFAVMKHLDVLERAGLVAVRRQGRERWNHLNGVPLGRVYARWMAPRAGRWASSLLALQRVVEAEENLAMPDTATATAVRTMHIVQEVRIAAPRERVWQALTLDIAAWWGAPYVVGEAKALVLEPRVGGRFYEVWEDGAGDGEGEDHGERQGALWGIVTRILAHREIEITGALGMRGAVHGVVCFELESAGAGDADGASVPDSVATIVKLSHRAVGEIGPDNQAGYDAGWRDLLGTRLTAFVERGERLGLERERA